MIEQLFKSVILISCIGTVFSVLLFISKPFTKKIFSSGWHYGMWLAAMAVMAAPVKIEAEKLEKAVNIPTQVHRAVSAGRSVLLPVAKTKVFSLGLAEIWLAVAIVMMPKDPAGAGAIICRPTGRKYINLTVLTRRKHIRSK